MAKQQMTMSMIHMYEKMVRKAFQPLVDVLELRCAKYEEGITQQVKKETGVYDLEAKRAALESQLTEIQRQLNNWKRNPDIGNFTYDRHGNEIDIQAGSKLDKMIKAKMLSINEPLQNVRNECEKLIRNIRLSPAVDGVKELFEGMDATVVDLANQIKKLPAPRMCWSLKQALKALN